MLKSDRTYKYSRKCMYPVIPYACTLHTEFQHGIGECAKICTRNSFDTYSLYVLERVESLKHYVSTSMKNCT